MEDAFLPLRQLSEHPLELFVGDLRSLALRALCSKENAELSRGQRAVE